MDFRILGPLEVYDGEGQAIELGGRQQRLVLAMLLLHRNEVVSVDRLIDAVWGERAPANAVKNVQVHVSRLRKALEAGSRSGGSESRNGIVRTRANGYVLEVARGELDVDEFQRLVEEGRRALAAGEPEHAGTILREALALWRGAPLADFTYDSFAQSEIGRLDELRLGAVEERIDADLALGRHDDVAAELQVLVAEHPLRERLRGQLMLALYRSGRQADALRVYEEARRTLAEELGLEPSESLQHLQRAVLTDELSLPEPVRPPQPGMARVARAPAVRFARRRGMLLGVGGALVLAAAVAVAVLALTRDRPSARIVSVAPNSLAEIDPETNRVVADIPVGARPASVVFANGSLWVANLDDDTVSRIDPKARRVVRAIATGTAASGLAGGHGAVWGIGGERGVVVRIDPVFNEVVDRIETVEVGSLLTAAPATGAVAATTSAVWAVSGGFFATPRVFRIDPVAKRVAAAVATGNGPTAIAVGFGDAWITDSFESTVSRIDPAGIVIERIPVGHGASAVAVGEGAVWVVDSLDDTVVRIDPETNSVTHTIAVGRYPSSIAVGAGAVWVANRNDGTITRIDPETNDPVKTLEVGESPAGLVVAAGSVWVTNQAAASGSRPEAASVRGIARFSASQDFQTDPALYPDSQISYATCAKLLNYPDAPAPAGTRLVPEVAASLPARSADGRTYTFMIRDGFAFSPPLRERVTAETFKYAIERSLNPRMGVAGLYVTDIAGQAAYQSGKAAHISGVVADRDKLSITLVEPAPDFLARIAMPFFCAVPLNTPIDPKGVPAIPSAGPYYIAEHVPNQRIVLKRNPNYHRSRPQRLKEIHYTIGRAPSRNVADVETGRSDYVADNIPPDRDAEAKLAARYGPASAAARNGKQRYFVNPTLALAFLALNTSRPLFSDVRLRKAVNYAIDRRALARQGSLVSGPFPAIPSDQYLPPTMPGASRTTLYPPAGDLRTARRLAPDARGTAVLYTCNLPLCRRDAQVIRSNLGALGLEVDIREFPKDELFERAGRKGEPFDILDSHWFADYADPFDFLNVLLGQQIKQTDPRLSRKLEHVARLSGQARYRAYAALSVELARMAVPWVAYATGTWRDFFSARIGCQLFQPVYGMDLAALCTRG
jgi:YVTN family beta-propeller protein